MKLLSTLGFASAAILAASTAFATPQYNGNTYGSEITSAHPAGYYVWNDSASPSDWHIRWTGKGATGSVVDWSGSITFFNNFLGSTSTFQFENSGIYSDEITPYNIPYKGFKWDAATDTTDGIDGIDFSLTADHELLKLALGSSLFSGLAEHTDDKPGVLGTQIYIGSDLVTPYVIVNKDGDQAFEIKVTEPGTLALFGLGISGLLLSVRRKKSA